MSELLEPQIAPMTRTVSPAASVTQFSLRDTRSVAPLTACADLSVENRPSTLLGTGQSSLDISISFANRQSEIGNRCPSLLIREGTLADIPFIDRLQKKNHKQVGFFPTQAIEGKIRLGHVLVAEMREFGVGSLGFGVEDRRPEATTPNAKLQTPNVPAPVGYLIGNDQYFKRDDVGCIFQINVEPAFRRHLVAAMLLKAQFERSAYGCRLYCCWCAQDIEANRFWEAMGFVPLAFRSGSVKKDRVHIFWQKRIREGDDGDASKGGTPWWFPSKTGGGSLREDRIVLPIPPGARWDDEMPRVYPGQVESGQGSVASDPGSGLHRLTTDHSPPVTRRVKEKTKTGGFRFDGNAPREKKPAPKFEPRQLERARELRDRWLEHVNADPAALLPQPRYAIGRTVPQMEQVIEPAMQASVPLLAA